MIILRVYELLLLYRNRTKESPYYFKTNEKYNKMQLKKNPRARLENYSKVFIELGLVLTLFIVYQVLEIKTYDREFKDMGGVTMMGDMKDDVPIIERKEIEIPKNTPPPLPEKITVVENELDIEETIVEATETDENEAVEVVLDADNINEIEEDEEIIEDIPFLIIENAPVYPGCTGNKKQLKDCFTKNIKKFFTKNFDGNLAQELGLAPGKKRIFVIFKIDRTGNVVNVKARAPHPKLQTEVVSVISDLPKMKPGSQRGRPVGVQYSLPILFHVK